MSRRLVWFSCGAASAVAAKLAVQAYPACEVVYCDTMATEHEDNQRFLRIRSERYATIDDVFERRRYMAGIAGAICTTELKKLPREAYQQPGDVHVFGYTTGEEKRAASFEAANPALDVEWILIDRGISKTACLAMLEGVGIALPAMYGNPYKDGAHFVVIDGAKRVPVAKAKRVTFEGRQATACAIVKP